MRNGLFTAAALLLALPAAADELPAKLSYDKGLVLKTDDDAFEVKLGVKSQMRFESSLPLEDNPDFTNKFLLPRTRFVIEGHAFTSLGYKMEFSVGDKGDSFLKDMYLDAAIGGPVKMRAGQWKRPWNRQEIVSDFASEFPEKAITNKAFQSGRDMGIAVHNGYDKSPEGLEWVFGVYDGTQDQPRQTSTTTCVAGALPTDPPTCVTVVMPPTNVPSDFQPTLVGRLGWNHGNIKGYSEADLEGGPLRYAAAASYRLDLGDFDADAFAHFVEVDFILKVEGLDVTGAGYLEKLGDADPELGAFIQAGYFLTPKTAQIDARFAIAPSGNAEELEARAGFNYYFSGHNWKWVNDIGTLTLTEGGGTDLQVRMQLQLAI